MGRAGKRQPHRRSRRRGIRCHGDRRQEHAIPVELERAENQHHRFELPAHHLAEHRTHGPTSFGGAGRLTGRFLHHRQPRKPRMTAVSEFPALQEAAPTNSTVNGSARRSLPSLNARGGTFSEPRRKSRRHPVPKNRPHPHCEWLARRCAPRSIGRRGSVPFSCAY